MRSEAAELTPFLVKRLETYFILHMRCMSSKDFDLCMFISNYHRKGLSITDQVLHLITTMTKNKRLRIIKCLVTQKFQSINLVWKNCLQHSQWIGTYVFLYPNYYKIPSLRIKLRRITLEQPILFIEKYLFLRFATINFQHFFFLNPW